MNEQNSRPAQLVAVLGRGVLRRDEPFVHADDLGLTRGDGCFDATLVRTGPDGRSEAMHLRPHLDRLARSAAALDIADTPDSPAWQALVDEALQAWSTAGDAALKLVLTSGREVRGGGPLGYLTITAMAADALQRARAGIDVVALSRGMPADGFGDAPWLLGGVKSVSYGINLAAQREAAARGADDCLFVTTDGYALEGPTSALLAMVGGVLTSTPTGDTGVLRSVTKETIFAAAPGAGLSTAHRLMRRSDLLAAQGTWLASSVRGVAPIRRLDGQELTVAPDTTALLAHLAGFAGPPQR